MPFEQSTQLLTQTPRFLQHLWSQVALSVCLKRKWPGQYIFFPNGSAGGPDGSRPQHLKDLIGSSAGVGGSLLLRALTSCINLILAGQTPEPVRPLFFGVNLVALEKKEGGVRPIAVGCTLHRLAAKHAHTAPCTNCAALCCEPYKCHQSRVGACGDDVHKMRGQHFKFELMSLLRSVLVCSTICK